MDAVTETLGFTTTGVPGWNSVDPLYHAKVTLGLPIILE